MNNINIRNVLLAIAAIVVVILGMNILSTLIGAIIPIAITGVVAFILGRVTAGRSMGQLFRTAQTAGNSVMAAASRMAEQKSPVTVQGKATAPISTPKPVEKAAPEPADEKMPELKNRELLDPNFEIKTPEQIAAESQRLEAEASQKAAALDPKALIEERKKRLLGNQGGQN
jgi:hypothetical protein